MVSDEKHEIKVISGEGETIPQYTNRDTFNGGTVSEMPLYLVEIDGISTKSVKSRTWYQFLICKRTYLTKWLCIKNRGDDFDCC